MKTKTGTILLSIFIALGLWVYVSTVVAPTIDMPFYNLQVGLASESALSERGLMLVSVSNDEVNLTLSGSRQDLGKINASDLQLVTDLSTIYSAGTYHLTYSITYPGDVPNGAISEQSKFPDRITVVVAERDSKEVPVTISYNGTVDDGYIMDTSTVVLSNTYVTVSGPQDVVDQIHHAAVTVNCEGATETIITSQRFELQNAEGEPVDASLITASVEEIRIQVPVAMLKTIPLRLNVVPGGGATEALSNIVIDPAEISISGSATALSKIEELVLGTVELGEITESTWQKTFDIILPEGVTNRSGITTATVAISFPKLATKEFTVTDIRYTNLAEGMQVNLLTKQLTITVRGLAAEIRNLTLNDIVVQVDLSGVENTAALEPSITFGSNFTSVGALGKYSVSVAVSPEPSTIDDAIDELTGE